MQDRLSTIEAKKRIRDCLSSKGSIDYSRHAKIEMKKDDMTSLDCDRVFRGGFVEEPDFIDGEWRYRVCTHEFVVVVVFGEENNVKVVTAWRQKR